MDYNQWIRKCVKNNLTIEQLLMLSMVRSKGFVDPKSWASQYINKIGKLSKERVLDPLINKGYMLNLNQQGEYYPEFYVITDKGEELFATYAMGLEFWEYYPKTLPLSSGSNFVSRSGIDKEDLIELYLRKIQHDPANHFDVMRRTKIYERKVRKGEINGHKIVDYVKNELWEIVDVNELEGKSRFGRDL